MDNEFCSCDLPINGLGCGHCGVCPYCQRRVNAAIFDTHTWNHGLERYAPYVKDAATKE